MLSPEKQSSIQFLIGLYQNQLDRQAPCLDIHTLRETYLAEYSSSRLELFTQSLAYLLETRSLKRVNDQDLELTQTGRDLIEELNHQRSSRRDS